MVPTSWLALLLFLLVVSPGLLFELLSARRRPGVVESAFREIGRIVLGSLGFTIAAIVVLSVISLFAPAIAPSPRGLITADSAYLADHYAALLTAVVIEAAIAHGLAVGLHRFLGRADGETIRPVSAWAKVFQRDRPKTRPVVFVRVRLTSGTVLYGSIAGFSPESALADRELILGPPLYIKSGAAERQKVPSEYERMIIRGSQIETIAVEYRPITPKPGALAPSGNGGVRLPSSPAG